MNQIIKISKLDPHDREYAYGASRISLCQGPAGKPARDYLMYKRGLDVGTIAQFRLGFVPFNIDHPFAGRVVFPIFDLHDRLIALSVRPIREEDTAIQKYWNEAFPKGEHLFGLNIAKYHIAKWDCVIITEGQVDVLKMHSHGFFNTVAVMGGALTPWHAQLLKSWTRNFIFLPDGDNGGHTFAAKAKEVLNIYKEVNRGAVSSRIQYAFAKLPPGEDPASFLYDNGGIRMREIIVPAMSASQMKVPREWRMR
jgi:DNA primase